MQGANPNVCDKHKLTPLHVVANGCLISEECSARLHDGKGNCCQHARCIKVGCSYWPDRHFLPIVACGCLSSSKIHCSTFIQQAAWSSDRLFFSSDGRSFSFTTQVLSDRLGPTSPVLSKLLRAKDLNGHTPLDSALGNGHAESADQLLLAGAKVPKAQDYTLTSQNYPLTLACHYGQSVSNSVHVASCHGHFMLWTENEPAWKCIRSRAL